jgi:hypothetical protein
MEDLKKERNETLFLTTGMLEEGGQILADQKAPSGKVRPQSYFSELS